MKNKIVTLTVNPSIDKSTSFSGLEPEKKIRCKKAHYDAGGGGINVSKAIHRLEGESLCVFTSGGIRGSFLKSLVEEEGLTVRTIDVEGWTRESFVAVDELTNDQYRFGFPGNEISSEEAQKILDTVEELNPEYLVISGSLSLGLDVDYYGKLAVEAKKAGTKVIADTSGEPLKHVLDAGVYLIKPNIAELAKLVGVDDLSYDQVEEAARKIIESGGAEVVVVSLGPDGAMIITNDFFQHVRVPKVEKRTTVGAGDSMVGGMVWALSNGDSIEDVIKWGVACGSAATMNEGTKLFKLEDAKELFGKLY